MTSIASIAGLLALILDSRTGLNSAREAINLCISTLIPSMFPFFILSILLTSSLNGHPFLFLRPIGKLCRIPAGAESLLTLGFMGGYPSGAQNVISAWNQKSITTADARRMVVFCNNAGPAFLFGFLGTCFDKAIYPWLIWGIHITSALCIAVLLPGESKCSVSSNDASSISISQALSQSIRIIAHVCGWVILFRVILGFLDRWVFWMLPEFVKIFLSGFLEVSNGCSMLRTIISPGLRMILASAILGFGGICVYFQTHSIAGNLDLSMYLPGKVLHGCISFLLSSILQFLLPDSDRFFIPISLISLILLIATVFLTILRKQEKPVAISDDLLYN